MRPGLATAGAVVVFGAALATLTALVYLAWLLAYVFARGAAL